MEGRLSVLSVQLSAVTAVRTVTQFTAAKLCKKMQKYFLLFLPQMQNCVRWKFGVSEGGEKRSEGEEDIWCVRGMGEHG